jgi:hypothetical protein
MPSCSPKFPKNTHLWALPFLKVPLWHANRVSLFSWKWSQPFPCNSERGAQPWIPSWSHSVIFTEHKPLNMELGLSWVFLVVILKGDLWKTRDTECVSGHEGEKEWVCVIVSWIYFLFAGVKCELQLVEEGGKEVSRSKVYCIHIWKHQNRSQYFVLNNFIILWDIKTFVLLERQIVIFVIEVGRNDSSVVTRTRSWSCLADPCEEFSIRNVIPCNYLIKADSTEVTQALWSINMVWSLHTANQHLIWLSFLRNPNNSP